MTISNGERFSRGRETKEYAKVNRGIRASQVRLVDEDGEQVGVVEMGKALLMAAESGLDVVEVSPDSNPPVCRIMDYSKFKYEQEKKRKLAKKKQHVTHIKEVRFKCQIEDHDYMVKLKHIKEFLEKKDKVRVSLRFRGRENAHKELGMELLNKIANDVSALGEMEMSPKTMGRSMTMTLAPKSES